MPADTQSSSSKINKNLHRVPPTVQVTMLVALVIGFIFITPYFGAVMFSALIALIFNPLYKWLLKRTKSVGVALSGTLIAAFLSIVLPFLFIIGITVNQATTLISQFNKGNANFGPAQIETVLNSSVDKINELAQSLPGGESINLNKESVTNGLKNIGREAAQFFVNFLKTAGGAVLGFISTIILSFFLNSRHASSSG